MDIVWLSRLQFAFTISFHYIYVPLSMGLGLVLVALEGLYLKTQDSSYRKMSEFWLRIFGLTFVMGAATGVVLEFEFGTNWATYSRFVGDVFGSPLAAEGLFAFFMESIFLGVLLFGRERTGPKTYFLSAVMVALGAHLSSVWIIAANSWQQTPSGFHVVGHGMTLRAEITDFWAMVFNPSFIDRLSHTILGTWQAGAFFAISVSAFYLRQGRHERFARTCMKIALCLAFIASWGQLLTGHTSAMGVARHQPAKLAAFEGHYEASAPAPLYIAGWVDEDAGRVLGIGLPGMLSWLVPFDRTKPVTGLNAFPVQDRPPVQPVFQSYHAMVGIGMLLIALSMAGVFFWWRGNLFEQRWLMLIYIPSFVLPQIANQLGWFAAEVGRQPWLVYNILRTSDAVSKILTQGQVLFSLSLFIFLYPMLFALYVFLLRNMIQQGPREGA